MNKPTILIVDDEEDWRELWKERLQRNGLRYVEASSLTDATYIIKNGDISLDGAIIDKGGKNPLSENPDWKYHDGLRVLQQLRESQPFCRTVLVTGEKFSRSVFESMANAFADKGHLNQDEVIRFLQRGPLTPSEEGQPILYLEGDRKSRGAERDY